MLSASGQLGKEVTVFYRRLASGGMHHGPDSTTTGGTGTLCTPCIADLSINRLHDESIL